MCKTKTYIRVILFILIYQYCSNLFASEISFEDAVSIRTVENNQIKQLKANEALSIESGSLFFVHSQLGLPLLVVSPSTKDAKIQIRSNLLKDAFQDQLQPLVDTSTEEIINGLRSSDVLVLKRDYSKAQSLLVDLKKKYPKNSSVLFANASLSFLMNDKDSALTDLKKGLELNPSNASAAEMLKKLEVNK